MRYKHIPQRIQKNNVVGPIKLMSQMSQQIHHRRLFITGQLLADRMHQDFGIGLPSKMEILLGQNLLTKFRKSRELPVESKTKPLRFFDMMPL